MLDTSHTDEACVKVPSFQKITFYKHQIKCHIMTLCFYILIYLKVLLTAMMQDKIKSKSFAAIRIFVSVLYMQEDNNLNNRNSAFVCNLHTNFVLLQLRYYQQHGIEIFSDYLDQILDSDKL